MTLDAREWVPEYYPANISQVTLDPAKYFPEFCDEADVQQPWPEAPKSWMEIHECPAKIVTLVTGRRGGKSTGLLADMGIFNAMTCPPELIRKMQGQLECWYVGPTRVHTERFVWERMKYLTRGIQDPKKSPSESDLLIKLVNGMWLRLLGSDQDPQSLKGSALWYVVLDEAREIQEKVLTECIGPGTTDGPIVEYGGGKIRIITTPNGHDWIHKMWTLGRADKTGRYRSWRWASWQSQFSNHAEISAWYKDAKMRGDLTTFRQEYGADFISTSGIVYTAFKPEIHVRPFDIAESWNLCIGVDNGTEDPTVCLVGAIDHYGRIWIRHEYYQRDRTITEHAGQFKKMLAPYQRRGQDPTLMVMDGTNKQLFREYSTHGLYFSSARNVKDSVNPGIYRVKECLAPLPDGLPGIIVHPECRNTIREMQLYRWKKQTDPEKDGWEIPVKANDHTCDVLRYICMARPEPARIDAPRRRVTFEDMVREEREEMYRQLAEGDQASDEADPVIGGRW